ncbi:TraI domain-containing protein [Paraburkholderia sp. BCC1876]|uniref:TraI domain-containing protein n=1 Tax=Paraburkholderia sp. BCC1876 TaxID=2676303 RepID=UPI001591557E|nr:TraI domain-containing protein [Paraburkholderia sp. BCC1876]
MTSALHRPLCASELVEQHRKRVDLISQCANESSRTEFDRKWMAVLLRCANWFSSLPLNAEIYREPGGAFRFTIETAFYAMRLAGGQKFGTNLTSEKRRRIEPQYNYAVFLAAVCSGLDEPHRHFVVTRERDMAEWNPSANGPAAAWLGDAPYRVGRRDAALPVERMRTGMLAQMLVGPDLLGCLDAEVLSELFGAINPSMRPLESESLSHKVVRQAITTAAEFDRKAQRAVFEPVQFTVPPAVDVAALLQPAVTPAGGSGTMPVDAAAAADPTVGLSGTSGSPAQPNATASSGSPLATALSPAATGTVTACDPAPTAAAGAPQSRASKSLMDVLEIEADPPANIGSTASSQVSGKAAKAADQMGLPFAADDAPASGAVNPADIPTVSGQQRQAAPAAAPALDDVLNGAPNIIRELFRALREDVADGKAKVEWSEKGLVLTKRLIGNYGVTSDTLVEHLRKRSLLLTNANGEITLAPRAGELILERSVS